MGRIVSFIHPEVINNYNTSPYMAGISISNYMRHHGINICLEVGLLSFICDMKITCAFVVIITLVNETSSMHH